MSTRKNEQLTVHDNGHLFNRRFMFAQLQSVPYQPHIITSSSQQTAQMFQQPQASQHNVLQRQLDTGLGTQPRGSDYNLFLRNFDSNQRLTQQNNHQVQNQIAVYGQTYEGITPAQRTFDHQTTNYANPYVQGVERSGMQTRYNSRKNEQYLQQMANRQHNASFTPQQQTQPLMQSPQAFHSPEIHLKSVKKERKQSKRKHQRKH